jgi:L-amino acid N-acyltransferase YncA
MRIFDIIDVNESNVEQTRFFCAMSKPGSAGYQAKLAWLKQRFSEGLKIKMVMRGGRGFIEYVPGEFAWRAIDAPRYMVVHCLWVVGREKGHGCGTALLDECIQEAKSKGMHGVAAVSAVKETGLSSTGFFLRNGFQLIDIGPPALDLVAIKFRRNAPNPRFSAAGSRPASGTGLEVVYSDQCPYVYQGLEQLRNMAGSQGLRLSVRKLNSAEEARNQAPSAYGTFALCRGGEVLTHFAACGTAHLARRIGKMRLAVVS